jgi:hypothetical protein
VRPSGRRPYAQPTCLSVSSRHRASNRASQRRQIDVRSSPVAARISKNVFLTRNDATRLNTSPIHDQRLSARDCSEGSRCSIAAVSVSWNQTMRARRKSKRSHHRSIGRCKLTRTASPVRLFLLRSCTRFQHEFAHGRHPPSVRLERPANRNTTMTLHADREIV